MHEITEHRLSNVIWQWNIMQAFEKAFFLGGGGGDLLNEVIKNKQW